MYGTLPLWCPERHDGGLIGETPSSPALAEREVLRKERPDIKGVNVLKEIGIRWKALSDSDKKPFMEQAEQDKVRFTREKERYASRAEDLAEE